VWALSRRERVETRRINCVELAGTLRVLRGEEGNILSLRHLVEFFPLPFEDSVCKGVLSVPMCGTDFGGSENFDGTTETGGFAFFFV